MRSARCDVEAGRVRRSWPARSARVGTAKTVARRGAPIHTISMQNQVLSMDAKDEAEPYVCRCCDRAFPPTGAGAVALIEHFIIEHPREAEENLTRPRAVRPT